MIWRFSVSQLGGRSASSTDADRHRQLVLQRYVFLNQTKCLQRSMPTIEPKSMRQWFRKDGPDAWAHNIVLNSVHASHTPKHAAFGNYSLDRAHPGRSWPTIEESTQVRTHYTRAAVLLQKQQACLGTSSHKAKRIMEIPSAQFVAQSLFRCVFVERLLNALSGNRLEQVFVRLSGFVVSGALSPH